MINHLDYFFFLSFFLQGILTWLFGWVHVTLKSIFGDGRFPAAHG